jgi:predicted SAM-dependent methyltransferase
MLSPSTFSLSLSQKFVYYRQKYGFIHAVCSYIGRYHFPFWRLVGASVSAPYLQHWKERESRHILNLGGGGNCLDGCLTVDIDPRADVYVDLSKRLPFADSSIDAIFCEEAIEHISLELGRKLLQECWRILKPGGVIRLTTPDLNWFASRVSQSQSSCYEINQIFYEHGHRYLYTREALQFYCQEAGFIDIRFSTYQDPQSRLGYLDSHAHRFHHSPDISQYLEAEKPHEIPIEKEL